MGEAGETGRVGEAGEGAEPEPPAARPAASRRRAWLALSVGGLAGLALFLAFIGKRRVPPLLPADPPHFAASPLRSAEACLGCHARGTELERAKGHTGRQDCWNCHLPGGR